MDRFKPIRAERNATSLCFLLDPIACQKALRMQHAVDVHFANEEIHFLDGYILCFSSYVTFSNERACRFVFLLRV